MPQNHANFGIETLAETFLVRLIHDRGREGHIDVRCLAAKGGPFRIDERIGHVATKADVVRPLRTGVLMKVDGRETKPFGPAP